MEKCIALAFVQSVKVLELSAAVASVSGNIRHVIQPDQAKWSTKKPLFSVQKIRPSEYGCFVWHAHMLKHVLIFCGLYEHASVADSEWCFRVGAWCDWVKTPAVGSVCLLSGDVFQPLLKIWLYSVYCSAWENAGTSNCEFVALFVCFCQVCFNITS